MRSCGQGNRGQRNRTIAGNQSAISRQSVCKQVVAHEWGWWLRWGQKFQKDGGELNQHDFEEKAHEQTCDQDGNWTKQAAWQRIMDI